MPKREPQSWEMVLKRNSVERLKRELFPTELTGQWDRLAETSYEKLPEEDIVRLQWFGMYHDKPKIGTFMMRVKIPSGILSAEGLRAIGEISETYGRDQGELTTRQNIQLHYITLDKFPEILEKLKERRAHDDGRMRRRRAQYHGMPGRGRRPRRAFRRDAADRRDRGILLRQSRVLRPAAQAQDLDRLMPASVQRARDKLRRASRDAARRPRRLRRARRRRPVVDAAPVAAPGRVHHARAGDAGDARHHRRLARHHRIPDVAGQGAPQIHDRRLRRRGISQAGRSEAGLRAREPRRDADSRNRQRSHRHPRAEAARTELRRLPGLPRPDERAPDARNRGADGLIRRRHPPHAPAKLYHHRYSRPRSSTT